MTEETARIWLTRNQGVIPALDTHKQAAVETIKNPFKNMTDLADVIILDPGLSVSVYQQANGKLLKSGKPIVASIDDALAVLGTSAVIDLVIQHKTLTEINPNGIVGQAYKQLMSRVYHLLSILDQFISIQGIRRINETRSAAVLHNIGEVFACLFDYRQYQKFQANFKKLGADVNSARPVFGFGFRELGRVICQEMHLPLLVSETLLNTATTDRRLRLIQLAADISHQAEVGWYHSSMKASQEVCAEYLNQSIDGFENLMQQTAIESARSCPISDILPAAARLIMVSDPKGPIELPDAPLPSWAVNPVKRTSSQGMSRDQIFQVRLENLAASGTANPEQMTGLLLEHLEGNLHMSRVLLLTLSADSSRLGTHASRGVQPSSLLNKLLIDVNTNRMFRSLLAKPLGLWINPASYSQYKDFLPHSFKNSVLNEDFFLMTLFNGAMPVGLIYCDRKQSVSDLNKADYIRFKDAIRLTSSALGRSV